MTKLLGKIKILLQLGDFAKQFQHIFKYFNSVPQNKIVLCVIKIKINSKRKFRAELPEKIE